MNEQCLTDAEIQEVVLAGPERLYRHSEDKAHMHLLHDECVECVAKLIENILLSIIPVYAGD